MAVWNVGLGGALLAERADIGGHVPAALLTVASFAAGIGAAVLVFLLAHRVMALSRNAFAGTVALLAGLSFPWFLFYATLLNACFLDTSFPLGFLVGDCGR